MSTIFAPLFFANSNTLLGVLMMFLSACLGLVPQSLGRTGRGLCHRTGAAFAKFNTGRTPGPLPQLR
jgi:hypothetical protein